MRNDWFNAHLSQITAAIKAAALLELQYFQQHTEGLTYGKSPVNIH